jgi:L-cysteine:1D-myo-inositol 2-amino-2-deoxy-alpha-D-glucopyranoside ligase
VADAQARLHSWQAALSKASGAAAEPFVRGIREALYDDLNAPRACDVVDEWAASTGDDIHAPAAMATAIDALLGVGGF